MLREGSALRIPTPPTMKNHGNYIASLCEVVRWLGEKAEERASTCSRASPPSRCWWMATGRGRAHHADGTEPRRHAERSGYQPPTDITARVVALSEGTRGSLAQAFYEWQGISGQPADLRARREGDLGDEEAARRHRPHLGWPLPNDAFGGSFMYPLEPNVLALGLVVGLDYRNAGSTCTRCCSR
jgi:electron-transferring-flavoprotein dehydrogenase